MKISSGIWSKIQEDPSFSKRFHGWATIFCIILIPISLVTGWINSVTFVAVLSLWALVSGHWSAWQSARVEVVQFEDANVSDVLEAVEEMKDGDPDHG